MGRYDGSSSPTVGLLALSRLIANTNLHSQVGVGPAQSFEMVWSKIFLATAISNEFETLRDSTRLLFGTSDIQLWLLGPIAFVVVAFFLDCCLVHLFQLRLFQMLFQVLLRLLHPALPSIQLLCFVQLCLFCSRFFY
jgi:hypothetical protein